MSRGTKSCCRLFIAVEVEPQVKQQLVDRCRDWRDGELPLRWIAMEQLHLTLAFLGDQPQEVIPQLSRQLERRLQLTAPFSVPLDQLAGFPPRRPHVLVAQGPPAEPLQQLYDATLQAVADCHLSIETRNRRFLPHITLARCRRRPFPTLQQDIDLQLPVAVVALYRSELTPQRAIHTALKRIVLTA